MVFYSTTRFSSFHSNPLLSIFYPKRFRFKVPSSIHFQSASLFCHYLYITTALSTHCNIEKAGLARFFLFSHLTHCVIYLYYNIYLSLINAFISSTFTNIISTSSQIGTLRQKYKYWTQNLPYKKQADLSASSFLLTFIILF